MPARKATRGGKRPGAGRKALDPDVTLSSWTGRLDRRELAKLAERLGTSESQVVRALIGFAAKLPVIGLDTNGNLIPIRPDWADTKLGATVSGSREL